MTHMYLHTTFIPEGNWTALEMPSLERLHICVTDREYFSGRGIVDMFINVSAPVLRHLVLEDLEESQIQEIFTSLDRPTEQNKFSILDSLVVIPHGVLSLSSWALCSRCFPIISRLAVMHMTDMELLWQLLSTYQGSPKQSYIWPKLHALSFDVGWTRKIGDTNDIRDMLLGRSDEGHKIQKLRASADILRQLAGVRDLVEFEECTLYWELESATHGEDNLGG